MTGFAKARRPEWNWWVTTTTTITTITTITDGTDHTGGTIIITTITIATGAAGTVRTITIITTITTTITIATTGTGTIAKDIVGHPSNVVVPRSFPALARFLLRCTRYASVSSVENRICGRDPGRVLSERLARAVDPPASQFALCGFFLSHFDQLKS